MSASTWGTVDRRGMRLAILTWVLTDLAVLCWQLVSAEAGLETQNPLAPAWLLATNHPAVVGAAYLVAALCALRFARRDAPWQAAAMLLLTYFCVEESFAARFGPGRGFYPSGLVLMGWLAGEAFSRASGHSDRQTTEAWSEQGAIALIGVVYLSSGIAKLSTSGLGWTHPGTIRQMILKHMPVEDGDLYMGLGRAMVESEVFCSAIAVSTVVIQLGAALWVLFPRVRPLWGCLLIAFHLGTHVLLDILYPGMIFYVTLFSFPWPRLFRVQGGGEVTFEAPAVAWKKLAAVLALVIVAAWVVPVRLYAGRHRNLDRMHPRYQAIERSFED
ncbi:MAG: HTTM domain-containing protein [Myxococcales bacterium]|nr:HTTM domain-containing protein [Myxococcales bacterium]MCB9627142.1 HTTM domain-containing protein [Sandaracinaceae bacterium]